MWQSRVAVAAALVTRLLLDPSMLVAAVWLANAKVLALGFSAMLMPCWVLGLALELLLAWLPWLRWRRRSSARWSLGNRRWTVVLRSVLLLLLVAFETFVRRGIDRRTSRMLLRICLSR